MKKVLDVSPGKSNEAIDAIFSALADDVQFCRFVGGALAHQHVYGAMPVRLDRVSLSYLLNRIFEFRRNGKTVDCPSALAGQILKFTSYGGLPEVNHERQADGRFAWTR